MLRSKRIDKISRENGNLFKTFGDYICQFVCPQLVHRIQAIMPQDFDKSCSLDHVYVNYAGSQIITIIISSYLKFFEVNFYALGVEKAMIGIHFAMLNFRG